MNDPSLVSLPPDDGPTLLLSPWPFPLARQVPEECVLHPATEVWYEVAMKETDPASEASEARTMMVLQFLLKNRLLGLLQLSVQ